MDGVAWNVLFSWAIFWFTFLGFSWIISLTLTLRGIAGGLDLLNISARVLNTSLCPFTSLDSWLVGSGFCNE